MDLHSLGSSALRVLLETHSIEDVISCDPRILAIIITSSYFEHLDDSNKAVVLLIAILGKNVDGIVEDEGCRDLALRYLNPTLLNCTVGTGRLASTSLAFHLARTAGGRDILAANSAFWFCIISESNLSYVCKSNNEFQGQSIIFHLLLNELTCLNLLENCCVPEKLKLEVLNFVISEGPYRDYSVALLLARSSFGRLILKQDAGNIARGISAAAFNHIVTHGDMKDMSVAYFLYSSTSGISFSQDNVFIQKLNSTAFNHPILEGPETGFSIALHIIFSTVSSRCWGSLCLLLDAETLNRRCLFGCYAHTSVAYWLAHSSNGNAILCMHDNRLLNMITAENLNYIIPDGRLKGESVALALASHSAILIKCDYKLVDMITYETLNHIVLEGPQKGKSVALALASHYCESQVFSRDRNRLLDMISSETFNHMVRAGKYQGESAAYWFSCVKNGFHWLCQSNYRLLDLINEETLNFIIRVGHNKDESIVYWLSCDPKGREMLTYSDFRLAKLIHENTIKHYLTVEGNNPRSPLECLAMSHIGHRILACMDFRLANMIDADLLNAPLKDKDGEGLCIAGLLASSVSGETGITILKCSDFRLANLISPEALNRFATSGPAKGTCVASWFCRKHHGLEILFHSNCRLLRLITSETLNNFVSDGDGVGLSVAFLLCRSQHSNCALVDDDYRIASMISEDVLNHRVSAPSVVEESVAFWLACSKVGTDILKSSDYRLANLISRENFNFIMPENTQHAGESIAMWLSSDADGWEILSHDNFKLAGNINEDALNRISISSFINCVAFSLSSSLAGHRILMCDNNRLLNLISEETLNKILVKPQDNSRSSLAYILATDYDENENILLASNGRLLNLISPESLNCLMDGFNVMNDSIALRLSSKFSGVTLLMFNNNRLLDMITAETVNQIVYIQESEGISVALQLALNNQKSNLLTLSDYRLAKMLTEESINFFQTPHKISIALLLFRNNDFFSNMHSQDRNQIAAMISPAAINVIIMTSEAFMGESLAFWMASSEFGQELLLLNDAKIGDCINDVTLNFTCLGQNSEGMSVAGKLLFSEKGHKLLMWNNCRLARLMSADALQQIHANKTKYRFMYWIEAEKDSQLMNIIYETYPNFILLEDTVPDLVEDSCHFSARGIVTTFEAYSDRKDPEVSPAFEQMKGSNNKRKRPQDFSGSHAGKCKKVRAT